MRLSFQLNGESVQIDIPPMKRLIDVLRTDFGLTSVKIGCGEGDCGACTILVNGETVASCLIPSVQVDGAEIVTLEYLVKSSYPVMQQLRQSFAHCDAAQCGSCTPGMIMAAYDYSICRSSENKLVTDQEIRHAIAGNLCRCTGYQQIIQAISESLTQRMKS